MSLTYTVHTRLKKNTRVSNCLVSKMSKSPNIRKQLLNIMTSNTLQMMRERPALLREVINPVFCNMLQDRLPLSDAWGNFWKQRPKFTTRRIIGATAGRGEPPLTDWIQLSYLIMQQTTSGVCAASVCITRFRFYNPFTSLRHVVFISFPAMKCFL